MKIIEFILELFNKMVVILKDIECIKKNKDMLVSFFSKIYLIVPAILFITCLSTIPSFFDFINGINNEYLTRSITFLKTNAFTIVVICFSIICLMFMYKARQAGASKANKEKIETDLAKNIHDNIVHKIRNDIKTLDDLKERKIASVNANNELAIKHENESIERELRTRTKEYVNNLSDFFSKYYTYTISACIKLVDFENEVDKKLVERRATTIARSKNTASKRRKEYETVTIGEYPDFTYLCEGTHTFYGKADLKKADDYKLPNKAELDEALSKYTSTLIVPIRYYNLDGYNSGYTRRISLDILGFLCIDCKEVMPNWEKPDSFDLYIMAIYADALYIYIKEVEKLYKGGTN